MVSKKKTVEQFYEVLPSSIFECDIFLHCSSYLLCKNHKGFDFVNHNFVEKFNNSFEFTAWLLGRSLEIIQTYNNNIGSDMEKVVIFTFGFAFNVPSGKGWENKSVHSPNH